MWWEALLNNPTSTSFEAYTTLFLSELEVLFLHILTAKCNVNTVTLARKCLIKRNSSTTLNPHFRNWVYSFNEACTLVRTFPVLCAGLCMV